MLIAVFRFAAQSDFDAVTPRLAGIGDAWERLLVIASHLTGAVGSDTGWRLWVESWRWALRDPQLRAEGLGDYTRWHELLAGIIAAGGGGGGVGARPGAVHLGPAGPPPVRGAGPPGGPGGPPGPRP